MLTEKQAVLSVVFFLPAFVSPFMPNMLGQVAFLIDVVFSYLYACREPEPKPEKKQLTAADG